MINYNLELLFQAMQNVDFDMYKSISHMDENEMQQLGHCFFAAYEPIGEANLSNTTPATATATADNQNDEVPF